jgi:MFS family permease
VGVRPPLLETIKGIGEKEMSIWHNSNFVKLFIGRLLANAGDSLYIVAAMWLVHKMGGSTFYTGLAGFLVMLPNALQMFLGPIVEKLPVKKTLVGTQMLQAGGVLLIPIADLFDLLSVWMILVIMPLLALINQLVFPIQSALLPMLLEKEQLVKGNTAFSFAFHGMEFVFSTFGGLLITGVGAATILWVDSIIFIAAMLCFISLRLPVKRLNEDKAEQSFKKYVRDLKEGVGLVFRSSLIIVVLGSVVANFAFGMVTAVLPDYADERGGAAMYGFYLASLSIGMLIGSLFAPVFQRFPFGKVVVFMFFLTAVLWEAAVYVPNVYVSVVLFALSLMPIGGTNVLFSALMQSIVPSRYFTRVITVVGSICVGAMPLASFLAGTLAVQWGSTHVLAIPAFGMLFISLYWLIIPMLRSLPKTDEVKPEAFGFTIETKEKAIPS